MKRPWTIKRVIGRITIISLLVFCIVVIHSKISFSQTNKDVPFKVVCVCSGDTIWSIASEYCPEGTDIRKLIFEIKKMNHIHNSIIYPGQSLKLPLNQ